MLSTLQPIIQTANQIIIGKEHQIRLAIACLLARGHLLIEDLPGMGKTTLSHVLAQLLGLQFNRIQFTSDLLPADIIGAAVYERQTGNFTFHPGPIFSQVILADEINRATPKAQSALLEAMEERQVTVEGESRALPEPFFVIATQNPTHHVGTFPLPESQLDRFLMCVSLGYPDQRAERILLKGKDRRDLINEMQPCLQTSELFWLQSEVANVYASDALLDYLQAIVRYTRSDARFSLGLSPRAALALLHSAQAWALMDGRQEVLPEDIQDVLPAVAIHRLRANAETNAENDAEIIKQIIQAVPIP